MKKLKSVIYCDGCSRDIHRKENQTWKEVLNQAGWKWCSAGQYHKAQLFCSGCTWFFEWKYNIDPNTGMEKTSETKR